MPHGYVMALRVFLMLFLFTLPFTLIGAYHGFAILGQALIAYIFLDLVSNSPGLTSSCSLLAVG